MFRPLSGQQELLIKLGELQSSPDSPTHADSGGGGGEGEEEEEGSWDLSEAEKSLAKGDACGRNAVEVGCPWLGYCGFWGLEALISIELPPLLQGRRFHFLAGSDKWGHLATVKQLRPTEGRCRLGDWWGMS